MDIQAAKLELIRLLLLVDDESTLRAIYDTMTGKKPESLTSEVSVSDPIQQPIENIIPLVDDLQSLIIEKPENNTILTLPLEEVPTIVLHKTDDYEQEESNLDTKAILETNLVEKLVENDQEEEQEDIGTSFFLDEKSL